MWSALWSLEKYVIHTQCKTDIDMRTNFTTSLLLLVRVSQNTLGVFRFFFIAICTTHKNTFYSHNYFSCFLT